LTDALIKASRRWTFWPNRSALLGLALLGTCALSQPCHADENLNVDLFNERYRSGTEAYEKQDFELAIKNFQLAYSIKLEPLLLYNIAQCHRKLNHDAEAITYYQSFLNTPEATDSELRKKAGHYLIELRDRHKAQTKLVYVETATERRPLWRIGLGAGLLAASSVLLGFGGRALYLNGGCVDSPSGGQLECNTVLDTQGLGTGLVVAGVLVAVGGAVTIAIPGRRHQVERPVTPGQETQPGVVKPMAAVLPAVHLAAGGMSVSTGLTF